ncbi:MAG TPA: rhodanese-related sulfurtransferase [Devosia sp.]
MTQSPPPYKVLAFYKFADLSDCQVLKPELALFCCARKIRGTFILAPEGINGTVAGTPEGIDELIDYLNGGPFGTRLQGAEAKISWAETMPFLRMKVRLKPEIVTLRAPEANPATRVGTYVEPKDWNALIGSDDVTLIDTRNDYEAAIGTFAGAIDPGTKSFTEFKHYVAEHLDPTKQKKVAMFCTGGIRCEKASSYLLAQGFEEVFHLKGGILKYLEVVPEAESRFHGECFVFDERVAVTHGLEPGQSQLCRSCRNPMAPEALTDGICADCHDAGRAAGAEERERQMSIARGRGDVHLGEDAAETAARNRAAKLMRRKQAAR